MDAEMVVMLVSRNDWMSLERIREALSQAGYRVIAVEHNQVAEACQQQQPDLIVASLSGSQSADRGFCQLLHRMNGAPIVAISSEEDETFRAGMLEAMVDDFITRPANPGELVARVRSILRRRSGQRMENRSQSAPTVPSPTEKGRAQETSFIKKAIRQIFPFAHPRRP